MEDKKDQKKCILILGMHRTGTSALSGALHAAGLYFGSNLVPPLKGHNDKGYFESLDIVKLNEKIYKDLGFKRWDYTYDFPEGWHHVGRAQKYKKGIKKVIKEQLLIKDVFGLKDPRISILLPLYLEVFAEMNIKPVFIRTYRSPFEVCKSLKDYNGMDYRVSYLLYDQHYKSIEKYTKDKPVLEVSYSELLRDPEKIIRSASDFAATNFFKIDQAKNFIENRLNRHGIDYNNEIEQHIEFFELDQRKKVRTCQEDLHKLHEHAIYLQNQLDQSHVRIKDMEQGLEQSIVWRFTRLIEAAIGRVMPPGSKYNQWYVCFIKKLQKVWGWFELRLLILPRVLFHKLPKNFNWKTYLDLNPDIKQNGINSKIMAIIHWKAFGIQEGRMWHQESLDDRYNKCHWDWPEQGSRGYDAAQRQLVENRKRSGIPQKKIVYLVHQFYPKCYMGTEKFVFTTARLMQQRGYEVLVITHAMKPDIKDPKETDGVLYRKYRYKGVPVLAYTLKDAPAGMYVEMETPEIRQFAWKTILEEAPDIVHVGHPMRMIEFINAAKYLNIPYIMTLTDYWMKCTFGISLDSQGNRARTFNDCKKWCCKRFGEKFLNDRIEQARKILHDAHGVYSPSQFLADIFMGAYTDTVVDVVPHGIDQSNLTKSDKQYTTDSSITFFYGGGIQFHKGIQVLVEAFTQTTAQNIKLVVYGSGSQKYMKMLEDLACVDTRVEIKGVFDAEEVSSVFKEVDVAIVPSIWWENYPLIIHEALVSSVPIIASNIGGMAEKVKDGKTGFTFEVGDASSLAQVMQSIADNPTKLNPVIRYLKTFRVPHPVDEIDQYESIYMQALQD